MRKYLNVALALMLSLSLVGITFVLSAPASAEDTSSISGCVSASATGDPIEQATVVILNRDTIGTDTPLIYEAGPTAADGSYTATGLPPAIYVVVAIADLYAGEWYTYDYRDARSWQEADPVSVVIDEHVTGIDFILEPGSCILGRVSDSITGAGIGGARIRVFDYASLSGTRLSRGTAVTDDQGYYKTRGLITGTYAVQVTADGYVSEWYTYDDRDAYSWREADSVEVQVPDDTEGIDFTLELGGFISGHIDDGVSPIADCHVYASDSDTYQWVAGGNTDADGNYTLICPEGIYVVRACASCSDLGYVDEYYNEYYEDIYRREEATPVSVEVGEYTEGIDFTLELGGFISGYIDDGVSPIADCHVQASDSDTYQWVAGVNTDADGNYTLICPEGSYVVRACASCSDLGYVNEFYNEYYGDIYRQEEATPVSVEVGEDTSGIDFTLELGGFISGQVTYLDDGESIPIFDCHVYASDSGTNKWVAGISTDADGNYTLNCPEGSYVIRACATCSGLNYVNEYWENKYSWEEATPVSVEVGEEHSGIDFALEVTVQRPTIEDAIADGIAWLVAQQRGDGSWGTEYPLAKAAFAVLKLESHATDQGFSPFDDAYPYKIQVEAGLDYIFANAHITGISMQPAGNPDGDADGKGVYFHSPVGGLPTYETSQAMMAIAASRDPGRVVNVVGSEVDGWTYQQVLQDNVDYLAWAQTDFGFGRGGWNYEAMNSTGDRSDQSNSGYVTLGLAYAEVSGIIIPGFVRSEHNIWIDYIQDDIDGDPNDGGSWYSGPDDPGGDSVGVNSLKTGNLLQQMEFFGDTEATPRVQDAIDYLVRNWNPNVNCYQTTYTIMKGLEAFNIATIDDIDWFADFTDAILSQQTADGWWPHSNWDDEEPILSTEWALLTLQMVTPPPGIDWIDIDLMKIMFDRSPNRDSIEIKAHFQLEEGASYNLNEDDVKVTIGGVVITIPAGSFTGSDGKYEYKLEGEPKIGMKLNFNDGTWSLKVEHVDASTVTNSDGVPVVDVTVNLMIGYMLAGQNVPTWCNDLVYP